MHLNLQEFEDIDPERFFSKEEVMEFCERKKASYVHELKVIAAQIKYWSDHKIAVMIDGVVAVSEHIEPNLRKHVQKTYKKFEEIKARIISIDKDYFKEKDGAYFYCPYIPLSVVGVIHGGGGGNGGAGGGTFTVGGAGGGGGTMSLPGVGGGGGGLSGVSTQGYGNASVIKPAGTMEAAMNTETGVVSVIVHDGSGQIFKC